MDVRIAAHVAQLTHIDPAPQAKSQRVAAALGQIDFGLNREDFETPPQLDHQTTRARVQYEGPVYVTSAFAQVLDMGMSALDFERLSFSVGKHQRCRDGLAGFVIQDAPFQPVQAQAPVASKRRAPNTGIIISLRIEFCVMVGLNLILLRNRRPFQMSFRVRACFALGLKASKPEGYHPTAEV